MVKRTPKDLQKTIDHAVEILKLFTDPVSRDVDMFISQRVLAEACGLIFIRLYRLGAALNVKKGNGIIIARLPDGSWSAPSGVSTYGVGLGHQAGAEEINSIIVINSEGGMQGFYSGGAQFQLGANLSVSAGAVGRAANMTGTLLNAEQITVAYAYSISRGLFAGYSVEGTKLSERVKTNTAFYERSITAHEILMGGVPIPSSAEALYTLLSSLGAGRGHVLPSPPKQHSPFEPQDNEKQQNDQPPPPPSPAPSFQGSIDHKPSLRKPQVQNHSQLDEIQEGLPVRFEEPPPAYYEIHHPFGYQKPNQKSNSSN